MIRDGDRLRGVRFTNQEGEDVDLSCDLVVEAIGQKKWADVLGIDIELESNGTVKVDESKRTSHERIYAGGDCINGGKEVVNAAADGRDAAFAMLASWQASE